MTTKNNYDQSSSGVNIEFTVFRDNDKGMMDFQDNMKVLKQERRGGTVAYYIDGGSVKDDESVSFTLKGDAANVEKYLLNDGYDLKDMDEQAQRDEIINALNPKVIDYNIHNAYDLKDTGLEFVPDKALSTVSIHGYSQGDYAEVIYCLSDLTAARGNEPKEEKLKEYFTHYFYDQPIYATCTINGTEYYYWDTPDYDEYGWNKDAFLKYVSEKSGVSIETLAALCPDNAE